MLGGLWGWAATPATSLFVGIVVVAFLIVCGYHRHVDGRLLRRRVAAVFVFAAATYTFVVCASAELIWHTPHLTEVIRDGFGEQRVALLLVGIAFDGVLRMWDEFRHEP